MIGLRSAAFAAVLLLPLAASAQMAPPPAKSVPAASAPAPRPAVSPAKAGERCFRLPLSDVAFGTEGATNAARQKLDEYAEAEVKKRNWPAKPLTKSNEKVSCEVYLNLGPIGTEYRCLVTTTFCQK